MTIYYRQPRIEQTKAADKKNTVNDLIQTLDTIRSSLSFYSRLITNAMNKTCNLRGGLTSQEKIAEQRARDFLAER